MSRFTVEVADSLWDLSIFFNTPHFTSLLVKYIIFKLARVET